MRWKTQGHDHGRGRSKLYVPSSILVHPILTNAVRYVALLAFKRIVISHSHLVAIHQDAILSCIDDPDISIRLQALELGASMVNSENLIAVVECLMRQLQIAPLSVDTMDTTQRNSEGVEPAADSDGENPGETLKPIKGGLNEVPPLPAEYRISIIRQILDMCSKDTYANIADFEWYIETLVQLVKLIPPMIKTAEGARSVDLSISTVGDVSLAIGLELQNVAVRVSTVREEAVIAATSLVAAYVNDAAFSSLISSGQGALRFAIWIVGEYAHILPDPSATLSTTIHSKVRSLTANTLSAYLQAIPKILIVLITQNHDPWTPERKSMSSLLIARITNFLEPLNTHPNLEVQERCVEFLELMRVAAQAVSTHDLDSENGPLLLTKAIPLLYTGEELKPVAPAAQKKVPIPEDLDLDTPINEHLVNILRRADLDDQTDTESADFDNFYNVRPSKKAVAGPAIDSIPSIEPEPLSYQQTEGATLDPDTLNKKRLERRVRNKDDPFYIPSEDNLSGASTPFHDILRSSNGEDVDVDSIPIMNLDLGEPLPRAESSDPEPRRSAKRKQPKKHHIALDETLDLDSPTPDRLASSPGTNPNGSILAPAPLRREKAKKSLLEVDSSSLGTFSLDDDNNDGSTQLDVERKEIEDADMARALAEVERLRMEMQRASERVTVEGIPPEGTLVKKKKKKKRRDVIGGEGRSVDIEGNGEEVKVKKKKRKKRVVSMDEDGEGVIG